MDTQEVPGFMQKYQKYSKQWKSDLYAIGVKGCSDVGCIFQDNSDGVHTNAGCQCARELLRTPEGIKAVKTIISLRDDLDRKHEELRHIYEDHHFRPRD